ncbi:hypothetical protein EBR66_05380 [bacterium]|nr:hypothetical protein [bacterium]
MSLEVKTTQKPWCKEKHHTDNNEDGNNTPNSLDDFSGSMMKKKAHLVRDTCNYPACPQLKNKVDVMNRVSAFWPLTRLITGSIEE